MGQAACPAPRGGREQRNWGEGQLRCLENPGSHREELVCHSLETRASKLKPFCHLHQGHCTLPPTPASGSLVLDPEKGMPHWYLPILSQGTSIPSPKKHVPIYDP